MADETMFADFGFLNIIRGNQHLIKDPSACIVTRLLSVGGDTAKAGMIVSTVGEAANAVDLAVTTDEHALGIILGPTTPADTYDLDDAIVDGEEVDILLFGTCPGVLVAIFLETTAGPVSVEDGEPLGIGTEAGKIRRWLYTNASSETDSFEEHVGYAAEKDAGSTADDHVVIMRMR